MVARAVIGGVDRHLGACKPSRLKLTAPKPSINMAALRMQHTIDHFPTDYDQGPLGSCGPNSLAETYEHDFQGVKFSRLFAYYFTRATEDDLDEDDGVTIPDLLDIAHTMGLPLEETWPYDVTRWRDAPTIVALVEAIKHRVQRQDVIDGIDHLLFELDREQPVMMGFGVPASMQDSAGGADSTAATGLVRVPSTTDPKIGGHCVNAIGFDRARGLVRCTCHYGAGFGDGGTIWLPFEHWTSGNVWDMRAIRSIS